MAVGGKPTRCSQLFVVLVKPVQDVVTCESEGHPRLVTSKVEPSQDREFNNML